jgi:hypothetical protein
MIERYNRLTESEFLLLKGTEKMSTMISNKFFTADFDVIEYLEDNSLGQFCVIKNDVKGGWIIYFETLEDVQLAMANLTPKEPDAAPIHKINIVDEF